MENTSKDTTSKRLVEGIKVEMEHTDDELVARKIALDHLKEDPFYYTKLGAMENSMNKSVRKALNGTKRLIRVAMAAMPEGTVSHRKDGDYKKTGGQWTKLPPQARQGQGDNGKSPKPANNSPEDRESKRNELVERQKTLVAGAKVKHESGKTGTISKVDENGYMRVKWDNGQTSTQHVGDRALQLAGKNPKETEDPRKTNKFLKKFDSEQLDYIKENIRPDNNDPEGYDADDLYQVVDNIGLDSDNDKHVAMVENAYYTLRDMASKSQDEVDQKMIESNGKLDDQYRAELESQGIDSATGNKKDDQPDGQRTKYDKPDVIEPSEGDRDPSAKYRR